MPINKLNELVKMCSKETNAREYATTKFQTSSRTVSKRCQFCKSFRRCSRYDSTVFLKFLLDTRSSRSAPVRVHVDVRNGHGRARGVGAAPESGARTKPYSTENSSSANRILRPRQKTPYQSPWRQGMIRYIFMCQRCFPAAFVDLTRRAQHQGQSRWVLCTYT